MFLSFPIFGEIENRSGRKAFLKDQYIDTLEWINLKMNVMNTNCLSNQEQFESPLLNERTKGLGRNFLYTVLVFLALCALSYIAHGF
jgi:hypothetical protein